MTENISKYIDYTLLKPDTMKKNVIKLCNEAKENRCASVCIHPYYVSLAKQILNGTSVKVCTVIGFPFGATYKEVKAFETERTIKNGAEEVDMVINIGALKDKLYDVVKEDIQAVAKVCKKYSVLLKVIIETCLLSEEEKEIVSNIIIETGADFVKTSTGFSSRGATIDDIKLIKKIVGDKAMIKASGGIRDYKTACDMIDAGSNRIGTSKLITENEIA